MAPQQHSSLLQLTETISITPLVEIRNPLLQKWYRKGVLWCHNKREGEGPLHDRYLADNLLHQMQQGHFDGHHDDDLYQWIAFYLGMIHGGVLTLDGTVRRDVTTLVTLHDTETRRGYDAGRRFFFLDADTDEERYQTDSELIERLKRYAVEHRHDHESLACWYFVIGNILGEWSGQLFPWTQEEHHAYTPLVGRKDVRLRCGKEKEQRLLVWKISHEPLHERRGLQHFLVGTVSLEHDQTQFGQPNSVR